MLWCIWKLQGYERTQQGWSMAAIHPKWYVILHLFRFLSILYWNFAILGVFSCVNGIRVVSTPPHLFSTQSVWFQHHPTHFWDTMERAHPSSLFDATQWGWGEPSPSIWCVDPLLVLLTWPNTTRTFFSIKNTNFVYINLYNIIYLSPDPKPGQTWPNLASNPTWVTWVQVINRSWVGCPNFHLTPTQTVH